MTNFELELAFEQVFKNDDCFDAFLALKALKKQYKKTDFYKQTHMPLNKAYSLYIRQKGLNILRFIGQFTSVSEVGELITEYLNAVDKDTIEEFFGKINDVFNTKKKKKLQGELNETFSKLKT